MGGARVVEGLEGETIWPVASFYDDPVLTRGKVDSAPARVGRARHWICSSSADHELIDRVPRNRDGPLDVSRVQNELILCHRLP